MGLVLLTRLFTNIATEKMLNSIQHQAHPNLISVFKLFIVLKIFQYTKIYRHSQTTILLTSDYFHQT